MKELTLSLHRRVRVWFDDLPDLPGEEINRLKTAKLARASILSAPRCAGLEALIPLGGRILYGLLGARFTPSQQDRLDVEVPIHDEGGPIVSWSLASRVDDVRAGLPEEYVGGVVAGIEDGLCHWQLGGGLAEFVCAAHGVVGSSQHIFRGLTRSVFRLLDLDPSGVSDEQLVAILEQNLSLSSD